MAKRIALIGNVGNCTYWYAKLLREAGHEVVLYIVFKKYNSGEPEIMTCQDPRNEDKNLEGRLPDWVKLFHLFSLKNLAGLKREFSQYDLVIAFESTPVFIQFSGAPMAVFATGSNLREDVFKKNIKGVLLKRAFKKAKFVLYDNVDGKTIESLGALDIKNPRWLPCVLPPKNSLPEEAGEKFLSQSFYGGIENKFVVFSPSRLDFAQKGTDILIKEYSDFAIKHPGASKLIVVDFGADSKIAKEMIKKSPANEDIIILPLLSRRSVMDIMEKSSAVIGYLKNEKSGVHHYPFSVQDPLKLGIPCISSIDREAFIKIAGDVPPVIFAEEGGSVSKLLEYAMNNKEEARIAAINGMEWVKKYQSDPKITEKLKEAIYGYGK